MNLPDSYTVYERSLDEGSIIKTITGLYGQSIKSNFPIQGTNGTTYTGYVWEPQDSQVFTTGDVPSLVVMPAENSVFVAKRYGQGTMVHMYYYTEKVSGSGYDEFQHVQISADGGINSTKSEDFIDLEGFTQQSSDPAYGPDGKVSLDRQNNYTIKFYYSRNTYDIVFRDGVYTDSSGAVIEETKMKDSDFTPATGIKYEENIRKYRLEFGVMVYSP